MEIEIMGNEKFKYLDFGMRRSKNNVQVWIDVNPFSLKSIRQILEANTLYGLCISKDQWQFFELGDW